MYFPYKYATEPFRPKQVVTKYLIPVTNISSLRILELHFELLKSFDFGSENNTHSLDECKVHELYNFMTDAKHKNSSLGKATKNSSEKKPLKVSIKPR